MSRLYRRRRDVWLICSAGFWLFLSWLALDVLPFRLYRYLLRPKPISRAQSPADDLIRRVRRATYIAARLVPWRAVCFHKGIAAHRMLRRRGAAAVLHYGVAGSAENAFRAHVWVTCDGVTVVGGSDAAAGFTELAIFGGSRHEILF